MSEQQPLYKVWPSKFTHFFCFGHCVCGKDTSALLCTILFLLAPLVEFTLFVWPFFFRNCPLSVSLTMIVGSWILVPYIIVWTVVCASTDPGIYPRKDLVLLKRTDHDHDQEDESDDGETMSGITVWNGDSHAVVDSSSSSELLVASTSKSDALASDKLPPSPLLYQQVFMDNNLSNDACGHNEEELRLKYCHTCQIYRPLTASHCKRCDNCVEHFDHHCVFLNQCIGRRNHGAFYHFLTCTTIALIISIAACLTHMGMVIGLRESTSSILGSTVLLIYCIGAFIFVGLLFLFHTYLIITDQTTNQVSKRYKFPLAFKPEKKFEQRYTWNRIVSRLICGHLTSCLYENRRMVNFRTSPARYERYLEEHELSRNHLEEQKTDSDIVFLIVESD